jgi:hypothetical protein
MKNGHSVTSVDFSRLLMHDKRIYDQWYFPTYGHIVLMHCNGM